MNSMRAVATLWMVAVVLASGFAGTALAGPVVVSGTTAFGATNSDLTISFDANGDAKLNVDGSAFNGNAIVMDTGTEKVTFTGSGNAGATVKDGELEGKTKVTSLSVSGTTLTVDPADKSKVDLDGDFSTFAYESSGSAKYAIDYDASSTSTLTVYGLTADSDYEITDGGSQLATDQADGSGVATFSLPSGSYTGASLGTYNPGGDGGDGGGGGGGSSNTDTATASETVTSTSQNETATDQATGTGTDDGSNTDTEIDTASGTEGTAASSESSPEASDTSSESGPGFGPAAAVFALALLVGARLTRG